MINPNSELPFNAVQAYIQHPKRDSQPFIYRTEDVANSFDVQESAPVGNVPVIFLDLALRKSNVSGLLFSRWSTDDETVICQQISY